MRVLTTQTLRCPVTNKSAYLTEARALTVLGRSNVDPDWKDEHGAPAREVYRCDHCAWWHLTKRKGRNHGETQAPAA